MYLTVNSATSNNVTITGFTWITKGRYRGYEVEVHSEFQCPGHDLHEMDHYGEPGTGFLWCGNCSGWADDPTCSEEWYRQLGRRIVAKYGDLFHRFATEWHDNASQGRKRK